MKISSKVGMAGFFAMFLAATGMIAEAQNAAPKAGEPQAEQMPVLLHKETVDVDGDGKMDTVSYFDSNGDDIVDAEAIDIGSTGVVDVLAIRCDADQDGKEDDWAVVNAATETVTAALIDADDDGEADSVAYANGSTETLPVAEASSKVIQPAFHY